MFCSSDCCPDHILTLQQSLAHYERMLSQSHPTYLAELRLAVSKTKSGADKAIVYLSVISMGVLCVQTLIGESGRDTWFAGKLIELRCAGVNSMNIHIPTNLRDDGTGGPFNVFFIVLALSTVIIVIYGLIVRSWWVRAKTQRGQRRL